MINHRLRCWQGLLIGVGLILGALTCAAEEVTEQDRQPAWNQIENIKEAAARIGKLHRVRGAQKAIGFIDACYRTHRLASKYSRAYEACIAQDFILAHSLAALYESIPAKERARRRVPDAANIKKVMGDRVAAAFRHYDVPPASAVSFRELVEVHGVPVYLAIVYPNATFEAAPKGKRKPKTKKSE